MLTTAWISTGFILVALFTTLIRWYMRNRADHIRQRITKDLNEVTSSICIASKSMMLEVPHGPGETAMPELLLDIERTIFARVASLPIASREEMRKEIDDQMAKAMDRIKKIEDRFPDETQIDKVASINDALLAERIDQLSKQVQAIEPRILTKWDVAQIVSAVVAGIIVVVGATYAVLKAIGRVP